MIERFVENKKFRPTVIFYFVTQSKERLVWPNNYYFQFVIDRLITFLSYQRSRHS